MISGKKRPRMDKPVVFFGGGLLTILVFFDGERLAIWVFFDGKLLA